MNLDANIQKILATLLKRWKLIIAVALIGAMLAGFYTANFTTLTYSSSVEFLAYAEDPKKDIDDSSYTSKMNYAKSMLGTYIEMFKTNKFNQSVADTINESYNTSYTAGTIKGAVSYETISETSMFKIVVTTQNADLSYQIAHQLEKSIPEKMEQTSNGVLKATVEDPALKAVTYESLGYSKKCVIGFMAGAVLAVAYILLRDLLDVRIKNSDELPERYEIPVLGTIPEFELRQTNDKHAKGGKESK